MFPIIDEDPYTSGYDRSVLIEPEESLTRIVSDTEDELIDDSGGEINYDSTDELDHFQESLDEDNNENVAPNENFQLERLHCFVGKKQFYTSSVSIRAILKADAVKGAQFFKNYDANKALEKFERRIVTDLVVRDAMKNCSRYCRFLLHFNIHNYHDTKFYRLYMVTSLNLLKREITLRENN